MDIYSKSNSKCEFISCCLFCSFGVYFIGVIGNYICIKIILKIVLNKIMFVVKYFIVIFYLKIII